MEYEYKIVTIVDINIATQWWEICYNEGKESNRFFYNDEPDYNNELAIAIFRYVFENVLEWTPEDIMNKVSMDCIKKLKLRNTFSHLIFPSEYKDPKSAVYYIAAICYPECKEDVWIFEYNRALKNASCNICYPVDLIEARYKASFLLNYLLIKGQLSIKNIEELYAFFSKKKVIAWLNKYRLGYGIEEGLFTCPLEYLHESREYGRNDFMLLYTEFKIMHDYSCLFGTSIL